MKKFIALCLVLCLMAGLSVTAFAATEADRLQVIRTAGIMTGDEKGNLNLEKPVTRAEFTKLMVAASTYKDSVATGNYNMFTDVKSGYWASGYIKVAVENGWFVGYVDGSFRPKKTITLEEGCTALLRVLGYDSSTLVGAYPDAQLLKAKAIGLRDDISVQKGGTLTRKDCVTLFYNLLTAENAQGQVYGTSLGYTVNNGEVDYTAMISVDLKGPYVVEGSLNLPFTGNTVVYRNGKESSLAAAQDGDVYYYNANTATVWLYDDQVTGIATSVGPDLVTPKEVTVGGKTYTLETADAVYAFSAQGQIRKGDRVTLSLGKDGTVVKAERIEAGSVSDGDYIDMISADLEGPYVVEGTLQLPFTGDVQVYRNGKESSLATVKDGDVYYYNTNAGLLWLYDEKVTGLVTSVGPDLVTPKQVIVSGTTYTLGTSDAIYAFSAMGSLEEGDRVTLYLGKDGSVVKATTAAYGASSVYRGVALSNSRLSDDGVTYTDTVVACSDGKERTFRHTGGEWTSGTVVTVTVGSQETKIVALNKASVSGTFSTDGKTFDGKKLAEDVGILDVDGNGNYVYVYPSRLKGCTLAAKDVYYCGVNSEGKIDCLILNNVTGDLYTYGYMISVSNRVGTMSANGSYSYYVNGKLQQMNSSTVYSADTGAVAISYEDGQISGMKNLASLKATVLSDNTVVAGSKLLTISDDVQVLVKKTAVLNGTDYISAEPEDINTTQYELTVWYDNFNCAAGNLVRVIVAVPVS